MKRPLEHDTLTWLLNYDERTKSYIVPEYLTDWALHRYHEDEQRARGRNTNHMYKLNGLWHYEPLAKGT